MENKPIATPSRTKEILNKYGIHAKKGFGQNFMTNLSVVERMAEASHPEYPVVEIGPGIGSLTEQLAKRAPSVDAFEIDERLRPVLADTLQAYDNVTIHFQDFLEAQEEDIFGSHEKISVSANLPYYVTTPILFKLFEYGQRVPYITVMVQKEVAERFRAAPASKEYSALSVEAQYLYTVKKLFNVARTQFDPVPNVDSAVVGFSVHSDIPADIPVQEFFAFVRDCFKQRRKTLYNNLKEIMDTDRISSILQDAGIEAGRRPQELSVNEYIQLYRSFRREG